MPYIQYCFLKYRFKDFGKFLAEIFPFPQMSVIVKNAINGGRGIVKELSDWLGLGKLALSLWAQAQLGGLAVNAATDEATGLGLLS
jgi:hypothetical protein